MNNTNLAYQEEYGVSLEIGPRLELIDGKIVAMSPRPTIDHTRVSGSIYNIFYNYLKNRPCEPFPDGVDLYLTKKDRFIPDMMVVCDPQKIHRDGVHGAPDLVVEVLSPGTAKRDMTYKKALYEQCGVREYWIVHPTERMIEQYILGEEGRFVLANVYTQYPDYLLEKMTDEEREQIVTEFHCSLFDDLTISIEDIFRRVLSVP